MNLRCIYCQTPFTLSRVEMLSAIVTMNERNQSHYDAHCPRCRRANSISRQRMELFFPNWQEAAKHQAAEPVEPVRVAPPPPAPTAEAPASAFLKTEPLPKALKVALDKKAEVKPAAKKTVAKPAAKKTSAKPVAKKPAVAKAPAAKKPAAKKPVAKKPASPKKK